MIRIEENLTQELRKRKRRHTSHNGLSRTRYSRACQLWNQPRKDQLRWKRLMVWTFFATRHIFRNLEQTSRKVASRSPSLTQTLRISMITIWCLETLELAQPCLRPRFSARTPTLSNRGSRARAPSCDWSLSGAIDKAHHITNLQSTHRTK